MTTTTAKFAAALALAVLAPPALAQLQPDVRQNEEQDKPRPGWRLTPFVELRQTWTDNVGLSGDADAQSSFITELSPGLQLDYLSPRVRLRAMGELHAFLLSNSTNSGTYRNSRAFNGNMQARLLGDYLFLDASGNISQQGVSPFGVRAFDNRSSSVNKAEVQTWRVSPYLKQRLGSLAEGELRYTRDSVRSDNIGFGDSDSDTLYASLRSGSRFKTVSWGASYSRQQLDDSSARDADIEVLSTNLSWRVSPTLSMKASAGYDRYDYDSLGGRTEGRAVSAGLLWTPSSRTSVDVEAGRRFFGATRKLAVLHRSRHTVWTINYDDDVTNSRSEYLLPAALDTAAMLDRLFIPTYSDPVERQRAVQDYIRSANLPASVPSDLNFFSNRFFLQRAFRASTAWRAARASAIFSVYNIKRDALSVRDVDALLLDPELQLANDKVTQKGANMSFNYRYTARTLLNLVIDRSRSDSRSAFLETQNNYIGVGARYTGPNRLSAALQLRHVTGKTNSGRFNTAFSENAISAVAYMKF